MKINIANTETEYKKCFEFIKKLWKDEFDIDFNLNLEKQYQSFLSSYIYFIEEKGKILAITQLAKVKKGFKTKDGIIPKEDCYFLWRIGVLKKYRSNGYGTNLINFSIEQIKNEGIELIYLSSEINNIAYYQKFGFKETGDNQRIIGNTVAVNMKKNIKTNKNISLEIIGTPKK